MEREPQCRLPQRVTGSAPADRRERLEDLLKRRAIGQPIEQFRDRHPRVGVQRVIGTGKIALCKTGFGAGEARLRLPFFRIKPQDALRYRQIGDVQNAVESFGRAIDLLPNDPAPLAELAMLLHTTGNVGRARLLYEKVLTIQPDNEIALNNLASIISEDGSDLNRALQLADRAKKKSPNDPNIADTLGTIYLKRGFPSLAIDLFLDLVKNFPTHPNAPTFNMHLGMAYSQKGDRAEAKMAFEAALKLKPDEKLTKEIQSLLKQLE